MLICLRNLNRNIIIIGFIKHNCGLIVYSFVTKILFHLQILYNVKLLTKSQVRYCIDWKWQCVYENISTYSILQHHCLSIIIYSKQYTADQHFSNYFLHLMFLKHFLKSIDYTNLYWFVNYYFGVQF
jgi:hypothetical protein